MFVQSSHISVHVQSEGIVNHTSRPPIPDQNVYHARTQALKAPSIRIRNEKNTPFQPNNWFWGRIKHPLLKQNAIIFSLDKIK